MIRKQAKRGGGPVKLTFSIPVERVDGKKLSVVGEFNDWDPTATPLRKRGDIFFASVTVEPGRRYAFRYYRENGEDGAWFNDESADDYEPNEFGGHNCVVET